jgi:hypothetical protein
MRHEVGLGAGLVQGTAPPTGTSGTNNPVWLGLILWPVTLSPLPVYSCLCTLIVGEVVAGCSQCHVGLWPRMCVRSSLWILIVMAGCAQGPASLCMSISGCFPSSSCGGGTRIWVWQLQCLCRHLSLCQCLAVDLKLLLIEEAAKLVGIT